MNAGTTWHSCLASISLLMGMGSPPMQAANNHYPDHPVRMVVPFPPGGAADMLARLIAQPLSDHLGQPVIIDNRPGADGAIAAEFVARSAPDGHTLFMATYGAMSALPALHQHLAYDPIRDFTPISATGRFALFLFAHPSLGVHDLRGLIQYAKAHPGQLNYATGNVASIVASAELATMSGLNLVHVPYKGEVPAMNDLLNGRVQLMFATPSNTLSWARKGRLIPLAAVLEQRSTLLPQVPTMAESGLHNMTATLWSGLFAPAGMPAYITEHLSEEVNRVLQHDGLRHELVQQGIEPGGLSSPEYLKHLVGEELQRWREAIQSAGIVAD